MQGKRLRIAVLASVFLMLLRVAFRVEAQQQLPGAAGIAEQTVAAERKSRLALARAGKAPILLPRVPVAARLQESPHRLVVSVGYQTVEATEVATPPRLQVAVFLDGKPTPLDDFADVLVRRVESLTEARGIEPGDVTLVIRGDKDVPARSVAALLGAARDAGIKEARLAAAAGVVCSPDGVTVDRSVGEFPMRALLTVRDEGLAYGGGLPPVQVRLKATKDGQLSKVLLGLRLIRPDLDTLQSRLRELVGDEPSPDVTQSVEVELRCDPDLRYQYAVEAVSKILGYVDEQRRFHRLVGSIRLSIGESPSWTVAMTEADLDAALQAELEAPEVVPEQFELGADVEMQPAGATEASEQAVALGLKWLAEHQLPDGGWSFDHTLCPNCRGQCRNPGSVREARNAATGLALLPFLAAGQTHKAGEYKRHVMRGLYFLTSQMKVSEQGGSLYEGGGTMYSQGICTIALCEAYAMTHDKGLYAPAQKAIDFVVYAQDPVGGGWRYHPRQAGDTSVSGWQISALKAGHAAYLRVPPTAVQKASRFLDGVQADGGAQYGYTDPALNRDATTAIGLLCRMYLGWKQENPALRRGVQWISDQGPSKNNIYYDYYATQVMRHVGGDVWEKWNSVMRDQLVDSQARSGHEAGSWFIPAGQVAEKGGRLYSTAMATMILEVYYRPIHRKPSPEEDFPPD